MSWRQQRAPLQRRKRNPGPEQSFFAAGSERVVFAEEILEQWEWRFGARAAKLEDPAAVFVSSAFRRRPCPGSSRAKLARAEPAAGTPLLRCCQKGAAVPGEASLQRPPWKFLMECERNRILAEGDVPALVRRFYSLQSERVEAYRLFEEGHRAYLRSGPSYDFVRYRQLVHEITQAFSGISREILEIKGQLEGPHGRPDLAQHLRRIQEKEKEKLELTAELQLAKQNAQDHPGTDTHEREVRELKQKLIQTIEAISEILQDFKYDSEENG
uniref:required for excision 1-B domain-containing protein n=1 Tax=Euleptes europaea TaxID=460621 RepID=UPI0025420A21|nr:required for excision 1-B domain-containing protein [Euleptes europaea]